MKDKISSTRLLAGIILAPIMTPLLILELVIAVPFYIIKKITYFYIELLGLKDA